MGSGLDMMLQISKRIVWLHFEKRGSSDTTYWVIDGKNLGSWLQVYYNLVI